MVTSNRHRPDVRPQGDQASHPPKARRSSPSRRRRASPGRRLPPRPPPASDQGESRSNPHMFRFGGGDSYRPDSLPSRPASQARRENRSAGSYRDDDRRREFSFRSEIDAPRFPIDAPRQPRNFRPPPPSSASNGPHRRHHRNDGHQYERRDQRKRRFQRVATHDRPIIRALRDGEHTPERFEGMADGPARFRDLDSMSQTESDMDLESNSDSGLDADDDAPTTKRVKVAADASTQATDSVPKWSNPDPYTVLPPPDESRAKKRDVVELIRKAKIQNASSDHDPLQNAIAENADYVPFDFGSDNESKDEEVRTETYSSVTEIRGEMQVRSDMHYSTHEVVNHLPDKPVHTNMPPQSMQSSLTLTTSTSLLSAPPSRAPQRSLKRKRVQDGGIVPEWTAPDSAHSTPWNDVGRSSSRQMGTWLHQEICDFYEFVRPRPFEEDVRNDLIDRISSALEYAFPGRVYSFGSFAAGTYLPTSDMDLVFASDHFQRTGRPQFPLKYSWMLSIMRALERAGIPMTDGKEIISKARVPIIKFIDSLTGIKVDISFENFTGVVANKTFQGWKAKYPAMPMLVSVIKQLLMMRNLNEVYTGGLGGFSITCLVVSLLQHHPAVQSGNLVPEENLGEVLLDFLDLYGNKFNMVTTGITLEPAGYFPKYEQLGQKGRRANPNRFTIIDPNNAENDISGGSDKAMLVAKVFSEICSTLRYQMSLFNTSKSSLRKDQSLIGCILGGNYETFIAQRAHLQHLYDSKRRSSRPA